jgi:hypothetical protein
VNVERRGEREAVPFLRDACRNHFLLMKDERSAVVLGWKQRGPAVALDVVNVVGVRS